MTIVPFAEEHLDAAAQLLAERHRKHREAEPLLPSQLDFRAEIETLWWKEGASGAFCGDGYVLGTRLDESWGPNAWVELAGHAVREPEVVRDLYAFAAERWVDDGRTRHYVYVPASDSALVDAWFRLGFGLSMPSESASSSCPIRQSPTASRFGPPTRVTSRSSWRSVPC
jgi:hypothetical protein